MTNLEYVRNGVLDSEAACQFEELCDALWYLYQEYGDNIKEDTLTIKTKTINDVLKAYRKLID